MKSDKLNTPIFVTGIERSGSSIVAKVIGSSGAFVGRVSEMQENEEIKTLLGMYYRNNGCPECGQYPLPDISQLTIPINWKTMVNDAILCQKYREDRPWMFKSSKLSQTWPVWHYAYPNAKWIIVRRRTGDIIQSCLKTGFMTAFKDEANWKAIGVETETEGWLWWVKEHEKRFVEMMEAGLNCKVIWPERMVTGDYQQVYEMLDWLGLEWHEGIVDLVIPMLRNSQLKDRRKQL